MFDAVLRQKLISFLEEDVGLGDVTTEAVVEEGEAEAQVVAREAGVIAGIDEAAELLRICDLELSRSVRDGSKVSPGDEVLLIKGSSRSILMVERTLLNILSRMSGVATMTSRAVEAAEAANPTVRVAATRKTAPGLRWLDKRAVSIGGGDTHRMDLHDSVLIKDNHVAVVGDLATCIKKAKAGASFVEKIEVEVRNTEEALIAARGGADIIMLDNMTPEGISATLNSLSREGLRDRVLIEASGNISLQNIAEVARTGVDIISVGALTHSPTALDLTLRILK